MSLTQEQRDAARRERQDVCVVGGPGTGKTRVLLERLRWRLERGISPLELLVLTLTGGMARKLQRMLSCAFPDQPELQSRIAAAPFTTFSGFCERLLREYAVAAGVDPAFELIDELTAGRELALSAEAALDMLLGSKPGDMQALLAALDFENAAGALGQAYKQVRAAVLGFAELPLKPVPNSAAVESLWSALYRITSEPPRSWSESQQEAFQAIRNWSRACLRLPRSPVTIEHLRLLSSLDFDSGALKKSNTTYDLVQEIKERLLPETRQVLIAEFYSPQRALLWEALDLTNRLYRDRKWLHNALDSFDLEEAAIRMLRSNRRVRSAVRDRYQEILLDESQDITDLQWMLLDLIRRPGRLFAAGDVNQSLHVSRNANPQLFREYRRSLAAAGKSVDLLGQNFRSRSEILLAARLILDDAEGISKQVLKPVRRFPIKSEPSIELIVCTAGTLAEAMQYEAEWVARRVRELEGKLTIQARDGMVRTACFSDMAVLLRKVESLLALEAAFKKFEVPFAAPRGTQYLQTREVAPLVRWLSVLANPRDEISLATVLRSPLVSVSDETILRLRQWGNLADSLARLEKNDSPPFDAEDLNRLLSFRTELAQARSAMDQVSPARLLWRVMDRSDYEGALDTRARANVERFLSYAHDWFASNPRPLSELAGELELLRESGPQQQAPADNASDAVRMLPIDSTKGMEFPIVFLPALHEGAPCESPDLAFSLQSGLAVRWRDPVSGDSTTDLPYKRYTNELRRREIEQENRLLYAGIARAEEHLVFSFATTPEGHTGGASRVATGLGLPLGIGEKNRPVVEQARGGELSVRVIRADTRPEPLLPLPGGSNAVPCVAAPLVRGQYDAITPVTSIAMAERCPRLFYLSRHLGWAPGHATRWPREETDEPFGLDASDFGRQVHALLAGVPEPNASRQAHQLAAKFYGSELGRRAAAASRIEHEFEFMLDVEGVVLCGAIDLWFEQGGETVLIDFKADDVDREEAEQHAKPYALQLRLYALALHALNGRPPTRAFVHFLRPDTAIPVSVDPQSLERAKASVRAFAKAQNESEFPLREGKYCRRCAFFRGLCPAGTRAL